ncbi:HNH endonuclease [Blautia producta]|uniref:HNH endonuclease n=1 Tax=Blautia producta TaxID=33035 RepID=UPI003565FE6C
MTAYDGEIWKQYDKTPYFVSTCGRVKRIYKNGKQRILSSWVKENNNGNRYLAVKIHVKEVKLARIVYETFNGPVPDGFAVIHRNKVFTDNALVNLKVISCEELGILYGGRTTMRRLVYCYDNQCIYKGTREAAAALHISRQTVSDYCNNRVKKPMFRLRWINNNE